jgi:hypothetical protein
MRRQRFAEQETLHFVASVISQEILLFDGLHPLGNDGHSQRLADADDRLRDGLVFRIFCQIAQRNGRS